MLYHILMNSPNKIEYKTIRGSDPNAFDDMVNDHLEKGYTLHGGVAVSAFHENRIGLTVFLVQAMIRTAESKAIVNTFDSK